MDRNVLAVKVDEIFQHAIRQDWPMVMAGLRKLRKQLKETPSDVKTLY